MINSCMMADYLINVPTPKERKVIAFNSVHVPFVSKGQSPFDRDITVQGTCLNSCDIHVCITCPVAPCTYQPKLIIVIT